jgi:hypothetical protein
MDGGKARFVETPTKPAPPSLASLREQSLPAQPAEVRAHAAAIWAETSQDVATFTGHPATEKRLRHQGVDPSWLHPPTDDDTYIPDSRAHYTSADLVEVFRRDFPEAVGLDLGAIPTPESYRGPDTQALFKNWAEVARGIHTYVGSTDIGLDQPVQNSARVIDQLHHDLATLRDAKQKAAPRTPKLIPN